MVKKCCMNDYDTNDGEKRRLFRFPNQKAYPREREEWIGIVSKIKANFEITDGTVLCNRHWPADTPMFEYHGKMRPVHPPSIFENIPESIVPRTKSRRRSTSGFRDARQLRFRRAEARVGK